LSPCAVFANDPAAWLVCWLSESGWVSESRFNWLLFGVFGAVGVVVARDEWKRWRNR